MRSIVASAARHADASAAAVGPPSRASSSTKGDPEIAFQPAVPDAAQNAGAVAASSQSASATARKSACALERAVMMMMMMMTRGGVESAPRATALDPRGEELAPPVHEESHRVLVVGKAP